MERRASSITYLFFTALALCFVWVLVRAPKSDGLAKVHMLNVGQGDSFLIEAPNGAQMLIDGGKDDKVLTELAKVMPRGDRSIDVILATHPDADHIGGLPLVIDRYKVGLFLTSKVFTDTKTFQVLYQELESKNIPSYFAWSGMNISLDENADANFSILFPDTDTSKWETNPASVVGRLQIGPQARGRSVLFTGDSIVSIEQHLLASAPKDIDVDILKLGHHGSKTSSSEAFLRSTSPALALISAGVNNRYGHPAAEVTGRLKTLGISSISTQTEGTFTLTTDGTKWRLPSP